MKGRKRPPGDDDIIFLETESRDAVAKALEEAERAIEAVEERHRQKLDEAAPPDPQPPAPAAPAPPAPPVPDPRVATLEAEAGALAAAAACPLGIATSGGGSRGACRASIATCPI